MVIPRYCLYNICKDLLNFERAASKKTRQGMIFLEGGCILQLQKWLLFVLLFSLYAAIAVIILFYTEYSPFHKLALFIALIYSTHFIKNVTKAKLAKKTN